MFFRWCGGCGSKKSGLMNMLEAQNTLVSILNPTVLTCRLERMMIASIAVLAVEHERD